MKISAQWIVMTALWCGCGGDDGHPTIIIIDAAVDAHVIDAHPDASVPSNEITAACTHMCDRIGECLAMTTPAGCVSACSTDLADCSAQQVMDVDACVQAECGEQGAGLAMCLTQIACVDGLTSQPPSSFTGLRAP